MITDVLNLRQRPANGCVTHPIACDILESLREMFAYADVGPERGSLEADLTIQAAALAASSGAAAIARTAGPVAAACRAAAEAVEHRHAGRQNDIASLLAIVRQTVDSFAAGHAASSVALDESTTRLEGMQQVADFTELKQLLAIEVGTLRRIVATREHKHDRTISALTARVAKAEEQLCAARR